MAPRRGDFADEIPRVDPPLFGLVLAETTMSYV